MVKKQCVELLPQLIQYLPEFQVKESLFKQAIESILKFVKNRKEKDGDKGVGFVALGKISLLASREQYQPYLKQIFDLVDEEMATRPKKIDKDWYYKPILNTDVLLCIRDLAIKYGLEFEKRSSKISSGEK